MTGSLPGLSPSLRAQASEPLRRFLQAARGAGLRVSAAEGIDAARAVDLIGYDDRAVLKDTLGLVLAKTPEEKALYDEAFELYFRRDALAGKPAANAHTSSPTSTPPTPSDSADSDPSTPGSLPQLLENDDRAALASALESAAREVGIEKIRLFTQKNLYIRQIL